ncbi:MAG: hypothetical protein JSR93_05795, partial [Verrucomicrobia bacterium]|nr:hypothetical protein [Verrucomicrobiota bacterium]
MSSNPLSRIVYDLFSVSFSPSGEEKKLKKEIVVIRSEGVTAPLSDDDVQKIVQTYCKSAGEFSALKQISIKEWNVEQKQGTVQIGNKAIEISLAPSQSEAAVETTAPVITVKHLPAIAKDEAKYGTDFWSNVGTLIQTAWETHALLGVASVLFFPITFVLSGIETREYDLKAEKVAKSFDVLFESKLPSSQTVNLEVLKTLQIFLRKSGVQNEALNETLANALLNGQNLERAARGEPIDFTAGILHQLNDATENKPVTIPCGQFQGELFNPSYLQIWKDTSGNIIVKRFSFTPDTETIIGKTDPIQQYQFSKEDGFRQFCQSLVHHLKPAPASYALTEAQRKQAPILGIQVTEAPEAQPAPLSHRDAIRDSLLNFGAAEKELDEASQAMNQKFASAPTTDPWKLTAVLLGGHETDLGTEDKNRFMFLTTRFMVRSLCKYASGMDETRREVYFARIEERVQKLEKKLTKQFGPEAKEHMIPIYEDLRKARNRYARSYARQQELAQAAELRTAPVSKPIQLSFTTVSPSETVAEPTAVQGGRGICTLKKELETVSNILSNDPAKDGIIDAMVAITARASKLIDEKKYEQAAKLANALLDKLPPLTNPSVWDKFNDQELKEISDQLTLASQYLFEAKLRLNHPLCNNVELVNFFQNQATLIYLARRRTNLAKQDLIKKLIAKPNLYEEIKAHAQGKVTSAIPEELPTAESPFWIEFLYKADPYFIGHLARKCGLSREQALSLSFDRFTGDLQYLYESLACDPYLQLGSDATTLDKVEGIRFLWIHEMPALDDFPSGSIRRESICLDSCYVEADPDKTRFHNWHFAYNLHRVSKGYDEDQEGPDTVSKPLSSSPEDRVSKGYDEDQEGPDTVSKPLSSSPEDRLKELQKIFSGKDKDQSEVDFLNNCLREIAPPQDPSQQRLPDFVSGMRRAELFLRSAQHPEHSLFVSYSNKATAVANTVKLVQDARRGVEDPTDQEAIIKNLQRRHRSLLREKVDQMPSRITLSVKETYLPTTSGALYPTLRLNETDSGGVEYFPFGLPGTLNEYTPPPNHSVHSMLCGSLPSWIASSRDCRYSPSSDQAQLERNQRPHEHVPHAIPNDGLYTTRIPEVRVGNRIPGLTEQDQIDLLLLVSPNNSYLTLEHVLDYIASKPHLLENPLVRMQIWNAFSKYSIEGTVHIVSGIDAALCSEPFHLDNLFKNLKKVSTIRQTALEKQQTEAVALIDDMLAKIGERALFFQGKWDTVDTEKEKSIESFIKEMSPYAQQRESEIKLLALPENIKSNAQAMQKLLKSISEQCLATAKPKEWKKQLTDPSQVTARLHYLSILSQEEIASASAEDLASYLQYWSSIQSISNDSELPQLFYLVQTKMENSILPAIDEKLQSDQQLRNTVCSLLAPKTTAAGMGWQRDSENDYIYTLGSHRLNIANAGSQVILKEAVRGAFELPSEILGDPLYVRIFGEQSFNATYHNLGIEELYKWSVGDRTFEIRRNIEDRSITRISQTIDGAEYVFSSAVIRDDIPLSRLMKQQGIWVKANGEGPSALLFIAPQNRWKTGKSLLADSQVLHLDLSSSQQLTGIWMPSAKGRQKVAIDNTFQANKIFQCCDPSNMLMLLNPQGDGVDEIVFLKENLRLKHVDNRWKVVGEEGLFLQVQGSYRFREMFGDSFESFMLPLVKTKKRRDGKEEFDGYQLRIWPHQLQPALASSATGSALEFVQMTNAPQMVVTQDAKGNWHGTPSSFLYLATVSYARGDVDQALFFLSQVNGSRSLIKKDEADLFDQIARNLQSLPAATNKAIAFQLKASLLISRVQREAFGRSNFEGLSWERYHEDTTRLLNLYQAYDRAVQDPDALQSLQQKKLVLTPSELDELQARRTQSLQVILELSTEVPRIQPTQHIVLTVNQQTDLEQFTPFLILMMQPPAQRITLSKLSCQATPQEMLGRFWDYWQAISSATKIEDLDALTPLYFNLPPELDTQPELKKAVETARSILLSLAELKKIKLNDNTSEIQLPTALSPEKFQLKSDLLTEMQVPSEWMVGRFLQEYYRGKHETSRRALEDQITGVFSNLLNQCANSNINTILSPPHAGTILSTRAEPEWGSIEALLDKLTEEGSSIPAEEKALYKKIREKIETASYFKESKQFIELLRHLYETKAPVVAMRYQAELQSRIQ